MKYRDGEEESSQLMRHAISLELCFSLLLVPVILGDVTQVDIHSLGNERTGVDRAV